MDTHSVISFLWNVVVKFHGGLKSPSVSKCCQWGDAALQEVRGPWAISTRSPLRLFSGEYSLHFQFQGAPVTVKSRRATPGSSLSHACRDAGPGARGASGRGGSSLARHPWRRPAQSISTLQFLHALYINNGSSSFFFHK